MKPTVLYLSPHRDDIAYSLSGRILAGTDPVVSGIAMTVFTKSTFAPYAEPGLDMEAITSLRRMEEERFCRALNLECAGLDFSEAPLRGYKTVDDLFVSHSQAWNDPIIPSLLSEFKALYDRLAPERVYAPLGIAGHVDHLATRFAAQMAFENACPLLFYEDLPYVGELAGEPLQSQLAFATPGMRP
jgi:LmbE family N-acetylglucosaminyl deacetylase